MCLTSCLQFLRSARFSVLRVLTAARSKCEPTRRRAGMKTRAEAVTIACPPGGPSDVACTPLAASGGAGPDR